MLAALTAARCTQTSTLRVPSASLRPGTQLPKSTFGAVSTVPYLQAASPGHLNTCPKGSKCWAKHEISALATWRTARLTA